MQIEVTAQNIDDYGLDKMTGNSKETLLQHAEEAIASGHTLFFTVPDRVTVQEYNVFDQYAGQPSADEPAPPPEENEDPLEVYKDWNIVEGEIISDETAFEPKEE